MFPARRSEGVIRIPIFPEFYSGVDANSNIYISIAVVTWKELDSSGGPGGFSRALFAKWMRIIQFSFIVAYVRDSDRTRWCSVTRCSILNWWEALLRDDEALPLGFEEGYRIMFEVGRLQFFLWERCLNRNILTKGNWNEWYHSHPVLHWIHNP